METKLEVFRKQIKEDIKNIQNNYLIGDAHIKKDEYAFNYWVLSKIFNVDEEIIPQQITEYSDKSIDCWMHFPEKKEIFIIQNKYYAPTTPLSLKDVSYFLNTPLSLLNNNKYTKSKELQHIFNQCQDCEDYFINLCFFVTTDHVKEDVRILFEDFNKKQKDMKNRATIRAFLYTLPDIYEKYFGEMYNYQPAFSYDLETVNKGTFAAIREEYGIDMKSDAYYIITPVTQIYNLYKKAEEKNYSLFEENIREFLGKNKINKGIIQTLEDPEERRQFLYYNNGITLICKDVISSLKNTKRILTLKDPQIINGCQTTNSIVDVLNTLSVDRRDKEYSKVYVMLKTLVISKNDESFPEFYHNVVKYTNRQNSISDKAFTKKTDLFLRIQKEFEQRGVLLLVKPSDKTSFLNKLKTKELKGVQLRAKLNKIIEPLDMKIENDKDIIVDLEKLLQIFLAFMKDGYEAYTKKPDLLKRESFIFNNISTRMQELINFDNLIRLYYLYLKAEKNRKSSETKRSPIPYYLIGFLGHFIQTEKTPQTIEKLLNKIFSPKFHEIYNHLVTLTDFYRVMCANNNVDFNKMLKQPIKEDFLAQSQSLLAASSEKQQLIQFLRTEEVEAN